MSKTTNKFAPEVRARTIRMVLDHEGEYRHIGPNGSWWLLFQVRAQTVTVRFPPHIGRSAPIGAEWQQTTNSSPSATMLYLCDVWANAACNGSWRDGFIASARTLYL